MTDRKPWPAFELDGDQLKIQMPWGSRWIAKGFTLDPVNGSIAYLRDGHVELNLTLNLVSEDADVY